MLADIRRDRARPSGAQAPYAQVLLQPDGNLPFSSNKTHDAMSSLAMVHPLAATATVGANRQARARVLPLLATHEGSSPLKTWLVSGRGGKMQA